MNRSKKKIASKPYETMSAFSSRCVLLQGKPFTCLILHIRCNLLKLCRCKNNLFQ